MALREDRNDWQALAPYWSIAEEYRLKMETASDIVSPNWLLMTKIKTRALHSRVECDHDQKKWKELIILSQTILKHRIEPKRGAEPRSEYFLGGRSF